MKSKKQKRDEALVRKERRAKRNSTEQLARLTAAGYAAKRERARLVDKGGVE